VLQPEEGGYHSGLVKFLHVGSLYSLRLDEEETLFPDPASRFQPEGPHGPSQVVDPHAYRWSDTGFTGLRHTGHVIYELHIGTFTRAGTYRAACEQLPELTHLGITTIELMPLADFPGRFGWGYDGVDLWAPTRLYGMPEDLCRFVDTAHTHGLCVILDVVYNHFGPDGNYLKAFSPDYFTDRYENEWGESINFDGQNNGPVREFFIQNARYWIEEYHFDGLRLDATQSIFDASEPHVIAEITQAARTAGRVLGKDVFMVAENESQEAKIARPRTANGYDCNALWHDDFHHTARVALTGRHEAYYNDYRGTPQEFISALKWGYLYQGQYYSWQQQCRGKAALDLEARHFVTYIQNHDQVANSATGERLHKLTSLAELRTMTALLLLAPPVPMLFQGQEFAASAPFLYFADHKPDLASLVDRDRQKFLEQFPSVAQPDTRRLLARPSDPATFERCKLDFSERQKHQEMYALHRDLLQLRHNDPAFSQQNADLMHGAVLSDRAFLLRFFCAQGDRLLLVNLGGDLELRPVPEPLLAPPEDKDWQHVWSSESTKYGGKGFGQVYSAGMWQLPARSANVFAAAVAQDAETANRLTPAET
jgi:maltooligosyltrehalose trehalohydrolase